MNSGGFRVLFHLCDCHNPSQGCFPSQAYLRRVTGLSNGGLNNALKGLEDDGLISRHQRVDPTTRKQRPTQYHLAFEVGFKPKNPSPESGDGGAVDGVKPSPLSGDGPDSTFCAIPSPLSEQSRLHSTGDKPVREPVNKPRAQEKQANGNADPVDFWIDRIMGGKKIFGNPVSAELCQKILKTGRCTEIEMKRAGLSW
jgi:hypothetical protein